MYCFYDCYYLYFSYLINKKNSLSKLNYDSNSTNLTNNNINIDSNSKRENSKIKDISNLTINNIKKEKEEDKIYAMKIMKKLSMVKKNQVDHIKTERRILELIDHPFINKLQYAFQTESKLYLVTDYCPGGELFFHIQRVERFNEEAVKFYGAQLVLALEHLHLNNIIYRE